LHARFLEKRNLSPFNKAREATRDSFLKSPITYYAREKRNSMHSMMQYLGPAKGPTIEKLSSRLRVRSYLEQPSNEKIKNGVSTGNSNLFASWLI